MSLKDMKFAFLGAGNISKAIIGGLIGKKLVASSNIFVYDTDNGKYKIDIMQNVNCVNNMTEAVDVADVVVLALKPSVIPIAIGDIRDNIKDFEKKVYISVAAAVSSDYISQIFRKNVPVIRTMPNTPLLLGEGAVAISRNSLVNDRVFSYICRLFSGISEIAVIDESLMNGIIAVNGSSPAYVYKFFKAMVDGAAQQGIPDDKAIPLILQSIRGALCMIERSGKDVETLIADVSSPGGTTIAALSVLDKRDFNGAIIDAMTACTERANEMAFELESLK